MDDSKRVTLAGNVHPLARPEYDLGVVEGSFSGDRLFLILKRSNQQQQALQKFLQDAHSPGAAGYHRWLTPAEFGSRFGATDSDIAAVTAWLQSHGLTVSKVHAGRAMIEFSGNATQLKEAFHTEIHRYSVVKGEQGQVQFANVSDPQIPEAFASLVAGVSPMQSFHAKPMVKVSGKTSFDVKTHQAKSEWTYPVDSNSVVFELTPSDFAIQYDLGPVYTVGTTGAGESIGILSASNVDLSMVQAYQKLFNLPANLPTVVVDGNDPGENDAATEAYLDVELAGAIAPDAKVYMYTSAGTVLTDPLLTAGLRALEDNVVSVISMSYGTCEAVLGASANAAWAELWQEAAAQGITGFVSAGDSGAAGCDDFDTQQFAVSGLTVNGMGSTPYNVSVGGTDFYYSDYATAGSVLNSQIASYWNSASSTTPMTSLLKAAPEQVWNDSFGMNASDGGIYNQADSSIIAGGGGASSAAIYAASGTMSGYPKPAWQAGTGVPADTVRDVPDVSLFAANGSNYIYYPICAAPGDCVNTTGTGTVSITSAGGTSAASPAMAGIQALVNQSMMSRQGQADYVYYALANKTATATVFRDVTVGGNEVPCYQGSMNCMLGTAAPVKGDYAENGYLATNGYDRATGLGSVDVANLIKDWSSVSLKPSTTTLSISPTSFAHGVEVTAKATVVPATGSGTPTGSITLNNDDPVAYSNELGVFTLAGGAVTSSIENLPGGTYQVIASYAGDGVFSGSTSAPVTVTVTAEKDTLTASGWLLSPLDGSLYPLQSGISMPYGSEIYMDVRPVGVNEVPPASAQSTPATGSVTFTDKVGTASVVAAVPLSVDGVAEWNPTSLAVGSHVISATYAGDSSYSSSANSAVAKFTVFKGTTTISAQPMETSVVAGSKVTVDVVVSADYLPLLGTLPTGSVSVTLGSQTLTAALQSWGTAVGATEEAMVTFSNVPAGILPLTASYAGDTNWNGSATLYGSVTSLVSKPAPSVTLTSTKTAYTPEQIATVIGTVTGTSGKPRPSGNLYFTWADGGYSYYGALVPGTATNASTFTLSFPASQLANGSNFIVATFKGDANYSAQSSAPLTLTMAASDFSLTTTTQEVVVRNGVAATGTVVISPVSGNAGGYAGAVAITCAGPTGITCLAAMASPTIGTGVSDVITFKVASTVAAGTYPILVTATGGGHTHSAQILLANVITTATPTFSPAAGSYNAAQKVTIVDTTVGATIFYTTDGTAPTASSTAYIGPITVSATQTLMAVAIAHGYSLSAAGSALYTITSTQTPTDTPTFTPLAGSYTAAQTVTIKDATAGAVIYYTTNGSAPTTASTKYTAPISVSTSETVNAVAIASGYSLSAVGSAVYTITSSQTLAATPMFLPAAGTYTGTQTVALSDATPGATIYYTTSGGTPTISAPRYTAPITVKATETLKAVAIAPGYSMSALGSALFTITPPAATPTFSPVAGTYNVAQAVTIEDATPDATIYYTTSGGTPTISAPRYTTPITVKATETLKAVAIAPGYSISAMGSALFTITPPAPTPTFSPVAGTYVAAQTVAIREVAPGATVYYTTSGGTPTISAPRYAAPITVKATETLKAVAIAPGYSLGTVGSALYTITPPAATPTFSPVAGTYATAQTVTIKDAASGAAIYYTTDGTTPTTSSMRYTAPISVQANETLKAVAIASGFSLSGIGSAVYTIQ